MLLSTDTLLAQPNHIRKAKIALHEDLPALASEKKKAVFTGWKHLSQSFALFGIKSQFLANVSELFIYFSLDAFWPLSPKFLFISKTQSISTRFDIENDNI